MNFGFRIVAAISTFALVSLNTGFAVEKTAHDDNLSLKKEIQHAIDQGVNWLEKNQKTNGVWSTEDTPAVTALALFALKGNPSKERPADEKEVLQKGYAYMESCVHEDGSIYKKKEQLTHNTALGLMALVAAKEPKYNVTIRKSRNFLIGLQNDFDVKGKADNVFDGGVGYGSHYDHSDLANTLAALEAIYYSKPMAHDKTDGENKELDWAAAIHFLQNCQNLPAYNKQEWAGAEEKNKGGFIYYPGQSMAGSTTNTQTGRVAFRSYGTASYMGMLSYIYADLKPGDPRVDAVYEWLRQNYTLEENPGMGPQGLYYYFHLMTKALTIAQVKTLETTDGKRIDWRKDLALRFINLQKADGSWVNDNGRWWEKDPALVTSYSLIALEQIERGLK